MWRCSSSAWTLETGTSRGIATNTPRREILNNGLEHSSAALVAVFDADQCACAKLPAGDGWLFCRRSAPLPRPDAALLPEPRSARKEPENVPDDAVGKRDVLRHQSSAASTSGTLRSSVARPPCSGAPRWRKPKRLFRHKHHGRIAKPPSESIRAEAWNSVYVRQALLLPACSRQNLGQLHPASAADGLRA